MTKEEFKAARKQLNLTQTEMGEELGISNRTVQGYEYGHQKISKSIALILNQKIGVVKPSDMQDSIEMNVENLKTLSLEKMAQFCIRHKRQFLEVPEIKILIDFERKDAEAKLMEQHIILKNMQNKEKS